MDAVIAIAGALLLAANVWTFALYGIDKRRAKKGKWRIPERTLLLHTWLLGGVGALLGMKVFRHKTQHRVFVISGYLSLVLTIGAALFALLGWLALKG